MKRVKVFLSLIIISVILFASSSLGYAIGFYAEEIYDSVFVIYSENSLGSGFAIGKNCIITNAHVISNEQNVYVKSYEGETYKAAIVGIDEVKDIAVLAIADAEFPYLPIADASTMNIGDDIYAIGAPKSMAYTLTKGVISAKERLIGRNTYIQIDAAINEGNSGGPLLNDNGQVLGINTLKMSNSEGIGLAIPVHVICNYLNELNIEINSSGNVVNDVKISSENETSPTHAENNHNSQKDIIATDNKIISDGSAIVFAVAVISLIGNVILFVLLQYQKKKNESLKHDPKERTDFDIDIWE